MNDLSLLLQVSLFTQPQLSGQYFIKYIAQEKKGVSKISNQKKMIKKIAVHNWYKSKPSPITYLSRGYKPCGDRWSKLEIKALLVLVLYCPRQRDVSGGCWDFGDWGGPVQDGLEKTSHSFKVIEKYFSRWKERKGTNIHRYPLLWLALC